MLQAREVPKVEIDWSSFVVSPVGSWVLESGTVVAEALAVSLDEPLAWAVGFFFGNTKFSLEFWNVIAGISGFLRLRKDRPMISFVGAIRLGFQRYSDFNGRSTRAEYWWWFLFVVLTGIALTLIDISIGTFWWEAEGGLLSVSFKLATLIPGLALGARRLHDINKSAWWLLMWFIVWLVIPMILLLVWAARQGDNGPNKYGLDFRNQP